MSKLRCECGSTIYNTLNPSPTEASLIRQQDDERFFDDGPKTVAAYIQAIRDDLRSEWLRDFFSEEFPTDFSDEQVVHLILDVAYARLPLRVCECKNCGRLYVQTQNDADTYLGYSPDAQGYQAVLKSRFELPSMET